MSGCGVDETDCDEGFEVWRVWVFLIFFLGRGWRVWFREDEMEREEDGG